jgi:hypothetical protein
MATRMRPGRGGRGGSGSRKGPTSATRSSSRSALGPPGQSVRSSSSPSSCSWPQRERTISFRCFRQQCSPYSARFLYLLAAFALIIASASMGLGERRRRGWCLDFLDHSLLEQLCAFLNLLALISFCVTIFRSCRVTLQPHPTPRTALDASRFPNPPDDTSVKMPPLPATGFVLDEASSSPDAVVGALAGTAAEGALLVAITLTLSTVTSLASRVATSRYRWCPSLPAGDASTNYTRRAALACLPCNSQAQRELAAVCGTDAHVMAGKCLKCLSHLMS